MTILVCQVFWSQKQFKNSISTSFIKIVPTKVSMDKMYKPVLTLNSITARIRALRLGGCAKRINEEFLTSRSNIPRAHQRAAPPPPLLQPSARCRPGSHGASWARRLARTRALVISFCAR